MAKAKFHRIECPSTGEVFEYPIESATATEFWAMMSQFTHPSDLVYKGVVEYDLNYDSRME